MDAVEKACGEVCRRDTSHLDGGKTFEDILSLPALSKDVDCEKMLANSELFDAGPHPVSLMTHTCSRNPSSNFEF